MRIWYRFRVLTDGKRAGPDAWVQGYSFRNPPSDKEHFFKKYLVGIYRDWDNFIRLEISAPNDVLAIGSGPAINELHLIDHGFKVTCSDLVIPPSYGQAKEIFGSFPYVEYDALKEEPYRLFDSVICLSVMYLFDERAMNLFFENMRKGLTDGGRLILDGAGPEDSLFSYLWDNLVLCPEKYMLALRRSLFNRTMSRVEKEPHGFKYKNKEIIAIAKSHGFELVRVHNYSFLTEFRRSGLIRWFTDGSRVAHFLFTQLGRLNPYVRMFAFVKR